ncbi:Uu.00g039960.m01.CDS01 [Anthostomella pinea]|uniref:Uu.00g039960.m01.CDS01 n=1 Tax=Anthostomella pinea TaxID=933095 RepID=A0AAI8V556_9PEZI|nr:Uu.00g039960.m01.CDS01 [Anthostomella pinea]
MAVFEFRRMPSQVLTVSRQLDTQVHTESYTLGSDEQWQEWLDQKHPQSQPGATSSINLMAQSRFPDGALVSYLPFSKSIFRQIIGCFQVHGSIARVINRNTNCAFTRKKQSWDSSSGARYIVYNCRSAASWPGDLALSVTFFPETLATNAILYGCDEATAAQIAKRLSLSELGDFHPMVLPTIFAELERNRQVALVQEKLTQLIQRIIDIGSNAAIAASADGKEDGCSVSSSSVDKPSMILWVEISHLRNGLLAFRKKMVDMVAHVDELQDSLFGTSTGTNASGFPGMEPRRLQGLRDSGAQIRDRLQELVDEYDEHIRDCSTMIDGMNIASQLEWNQIGRRDARTNLDIANNNLQVAQRARRDSKLMKSIAMLTMIFLPGTFVATLFSMGFFSWEGGTGSGMTVSSDIWIYVLATVLVTSMTLGSWYLWALRRKEVGDVEKQMATG